MVILSWFFYYFFLLLKLYQLSVVHWSVEKWFLFRFGEQLKRGGNKSSKSILAQEDSDKRLNSVCQLFSADILAWSLKWQTNKARSIAFFIEVWKHVEINTHDCAILTENFKARECSISLNRFIQIGKRGLYVMYL